MARNDITWDYYRVGQHKGRPVKHQHSPDGINWFDVSVDEMPKMIHPKSDVVAEVLPPSLPIVRCKCGSVSFSRSLPTFPASPMIPLVTCNVCGKELVVSNG